VVRRGEIWWGEDPDLGRRPFLIMTRDAGIPVLNRLLAVPVTTRVRGIPTELPLTREDGMPRECAAAFDNLGPVLKTHLVERITRLSPLRMREACAAARRAIDCE
jgi:mRNA interferase MazF